MAEKAKSALQQLATDEWRLCGMIESICQLDMYFLPDEKQQLITNINLGLKRIKDLKAKPQPRIAKRWSCVK